MAFLCLCASVTKVTRSRQTVKLTLYHRAETLRALIYRRLIHRTEPNRPHISSDISISNSVETKRNKCALNYRRARPSTSEFLLTASEPSRPFPTRPTRLAPRQCISAPPVRGVLRLVRSGRKGFFRQKAQQGAFCWNIYDNRQQNKRDSPRNMGFAAARTAKTPQQRPESAPHFWPANSKCAPERATRYLQGSESRHLHGIARGHPALRRSSQAACRIPAVAVLHRS